jgi:hypothetical protein
MYYIMHKDFATPLLDMYPEAATYNNKTLVLTGEEPIGFAGEVVRICDQQLSDEELVSLVDKMLTETPTGRLVMLSKPQGKYLHANHSAFITPPEPEE